MKLYPLQQLTRPDLQSHIYSKALLGNLAGLNALRIKPRDAFLWHRLAQIRLQQGQYGLAESLAQKSSALARDDTQLQMKNTRLLKQARALAKETVIR